MYYRVAEDVVERRLELLGRRGFAAALAHALSSVLVVGFVAAYLAVITVSFASKLPPNWSVRLDVWWRLIAAELLMGLPAIVVGYLFLRAIAAAWGGGWRRLTWDERLAEFTALKRVGVLRLAHYSSIPFAELEQIVLQTSPGGRNLTIKFSVEANNFVTYPVVQAIGVVRHVDRREEAMDLLFRLGRACGLVFYSVEESDLRHLKLCVRRQPTDRQNDRRFQPIPAVASAARYEDNLAPLPISAPQIEMDAFQPQMLASLAQGTKLAEWQPGTRVRFHTPPADWALHVVYAAVAAIVAGVVAYNAAGLVRQWLPGWATMLLAITLAPLGANGWVFWRHRERELTLDWSSKLLTSRVGNRTRQLPFAAIESLQLRGLKRTVNPKKRPSYDQHWGRLELKLDRGTILVLESDPLPRDPDGPPRRLGPLAKALADALGVPWQWLDYS